MAFGLEETFFFYKYSEGKKILRNLSSEWDLNKEILKEIGKTMIFLGYQKGYFTQKTDLVVEEFMNRVSETSFEELNYKNMINYCTYLVSSISPGKAQLQFSKKSMSFIKEIELNKETTINELINRINDPDKQKENHTIHTIEYNGIEQLKKTIFDT